LVHPPAEPGVSFRPDLDRFLAPLASICHVLLSARFPGIIIGGIAASLVGRPRFTRDIDAVVLHADDALDDLLALLREGRIVPRTTDAVAFARATRVLLLRHEPSEVPVDLSLGLIPFEVTAVEKREVREVSGIEIPLPRVEDLIVMKAIAQRPQDLEDIRGILIAHPELNRAAVRKTVREFAEVLESPEIVRELDRLFRATGR